MMKFASTWAFALVSAWAALAGAGSLAQAQDKSEPWEVLTAYDKDDKPRDFPRIALRPNVTQSVFIYLKNTGAVSKKNLAVSLVRLSPQGKPQVLGQATVKIGINQQELLKFKPIPPAKDEPPPKGEPAAPTDQGFPFQMQLWLLPEGKKDPVKLHLPVAILHPSQYVTARAAFDRVKNRLSVDVKADPDSANPPCETKLVLAREMLPGLIFPKQGLFSAELTRESFAKVLHAADVQFQQGVAPRNGRIYLAIDGFERAYTFKGTFDQGNLPQLGMQNRARLIAPRYVVPKVDAPDDPKPDPKTVNKTTLKLEVDGALDQDARVEVALDRSGDGRFEPLRIFPGLREQSLSVAIGADGEALCKTMVRDWRLDLDTTGVLGKRSLRVRILGGNGKPLALADEQNQKDETPALFSRDPAENPFAPLSFDAVEKAVYAEILVDATGPEDVKLIDLPSSTYPGAVLKLKARAKRRDADQAPFSKVQFFVGDPQKDPPIPAKLDKEINLWHATFPVPGSAADKLAVSVQFTTATGLSALAGAGITVSKKEDAPEDMSKITGKVLSFFTKKGVPDMEVTLQEGKKDKAKTKTNKEGVYLFKDVAPGDYLVVETRSKASATATVPKGKAVTVTADITMKRMP